MLIDGPHSLRFQHGIVFFLYFWSCLFPNLVSMVSLPFSFSFNVLIWYLTVSYLFHSWRFVWKQKLNASFWGFQVKRTLGQFTPARWDKDEWHPFLGPFRFIQVLSLCIIFLTVELNTFFLKFCLWVPPRNPIIVYRLVLWWLIAIPTIREYNSYLQDRYLTYFIHFFWCLKFERFNVSKVLILAFFPPTIPLSYRKLVKKVGTFCWLSVAICIVELLICIKFGHGKVFFFMVQHESRNLKCFRIFFCHRLTKWYLYITLINNQACSQIRCRGGW